MFLEIAIEKNYEQLRLKLFINIYCMVMIFISLFSYDFKLLHN